MEPGDDSEARARHFGAEVIRLSDLTVAPEVIAIIPGYMAKKHRVIPVSQDNNVVKIAITDPSDLAALDALCYLIQAEIHLVVATKTDIESALSKYYPPPDQHLWS